MPLKKTDIAKFKKRLEDMRADMSRLLEGTAAEVKKPDEATGYSQHQADQGTDDFDRQIGLELTSREYGVLKQIERALEKIEEGTYGICDDSGVEIPVARLNAVPYATRTAQAQEKFEKSMGIR
jgi:DnaK suppressor protein